MASTWSKLEGVHPDRALRAPAACCPSSSTGTLFAINNLQQSYVDDRLLVEPIYPIAALAAPGGSVGRRPQRGGPGRRAIKFPPSTIRRIRPRAVHAEPLHP